MYIHGRSEANTACSRPHHPDFANPIRYLAQLYPGPDARLWEVRRVEAIEVELHSLCTVRLEVDRLDCAIPRLAARAHHSDDRTPEVENDALVGPRTRAHMTLEGHKLEHRDILALVSRIRVEDMWGRSMAESRPEARSERGARGRQRSVEI